MLESHESCDLPREVISEVVFSGICGSFILMNFILSILDSHPISLECGVSLMDLCTVLYWGLGFFLTDLVVRKAKLLIIFRLPDLC